MNFASIHMQYRDDHACRTRFFVKLFNTKDETIKHLIAEMDVPRICFDEDIINSDRVCEKISRVLCEHPICIWEWKRRGNGDYYAVTECEENGQVAIEHDTLRENSVDLDDIIGDADQLIQSNV